MIKKIIPSLILIGCSTAFAMNEGPRFDFLPNIYTNQLKAQNPSELTSLENKAVELVKKTLKISSASPYTSIRIRFIYDANKHPIALLAYLLSSKVKTFEVVRLNLNNAFQVTSMVNHYNLTDADYNQIPSHVDQTTPVCPDNNIQFVIGNNFNGDVSVEKEVRYVYQIAKDKGYNPVLMDVNDSSTPKPTVASYKNWMSCPNVKGFYNESHGATSEILLSDDVLTYKDVQKDLVFKLRGDVVLFDSCSTFNDPLLSAMIKPFKANAQQYLGGIVPLPFGASERTASCFWAAVINHSLMNKKLVDECSIRSGLQLDSFGITQKQNKYLRPAH